MKAVFGLVLLIGLALAGTAVWMVRGHFQEQSGELARAYAMLRAVTPTVQVYAVKRPMAYGERLTPDDVQLVQYAEPFLPEGVFKTEEELFPKGADVPRTVLRPMIPNEPVLAVKVTDPGQDAGITQRLSAGMRAFTISVDASTGVGGFLRPGDKVDVYWTGAVRESGDSRQVTQLIESGLRLVAIDQSADDTQVDATVARTVTVEVSPQQVANLAQAASTGGLSLSLVGQDDQTVASAIEVDQKSLLGLEDPPAPEPAPVEVAVVSPPPPPPPPRICTVRERKGADVVETQVDCPKTE